MISRVLNGNVYRNYTLCYKRNKKHNYTWKKYFATIFENPHTCISTILHGLKNTFQTMWNKKYLKRVIISYLKITLIHFNGALAKHSSNIDLKSKDMGWFYRS